MRNKFKTRIHRKFLIKSNHGAIGIGAMIVFIAMVLVAGIAASVIIQTSSKLENQALRTGSDTSAEVATGLAVINIQGHIGNSSLKLDRMVLMIRTRAGTGDIDLKNTLLEVSDGSKKFVLNYSQSHFAASPSIAGIFETPVFATLSNGVFGLIEIDDKDGSCAASNPIINRGDKILICINTSTTFGNNGINVRTDIWGGLIPEDGAIGVIKFTTPGVYKDRVLILQE